MLLTTLCCTYFKNYRSIVLDFTQLNWIVGANGAGKTNLLDAIHYLSFTKSAFTNQDVHNIQHGELAFRVQGLFCKGQQEYAVQCRVQQGKGKVVMNNDKPYAKLHDHIGRFPIVLMLPYDTDMVRGNSRERRKWVDSILCQTDRGYLQDLMRYNHMVTQRNSVLQRGKLVDPDLVAAYNQPLIVLAQRIFAARQAFITAFVPIFMEYYRYVVAERETVAVSYVSAVGDPDFARRFVDSLPQDRVLQRTTLGIHRDDFVFLLNGHLLKRVGSQGQQKSFVMALRLAQGRFLQQALQVQPLLLIDDIGDKLDLARIDRVLQLITTSGFGQVFITDTDHRLLAMVPAEKTLFRIEQGVLCSQERMG